MPRHEPGRCSATPIMQAAPYARPLPVCLSLPRPSRYTLAMFELLATDGAARRGRLVTARGAIDTPAFMPVGTQGSVKAVSPDELRALGAEVILGNTYHLLVRPGIALIEQLGGLHRFTAWDRPILTDSGGFQVFSLAKLRKITPEGAHFQSHVDGAPLFLGPREALDTQARLGADIAMLFDECPPWPADHATVEAAVHRTLEWARVSREFPPAPLTPLPGAAPTQVTRQLRFAIVQGGSHPDLREACARELTALGFDGYAVGGVSVGEPEPEMFAAIEASTPHLPAGKPRYAMGLGMPHQMIGMIARGIDMFDCVLPTRMARNGTVFVEDGMLNLENAAFTDDPRPIEEGCACPACRAFSRAYIRHLLRAREILGVRLTSLHNLHFYLHLMRRAREAIATGAFHAFRAAFTARFKPRE